MHPFEIHLLNTKSAAEPCVYFVRYTVPGGFHLYFMLHKWLGPPTGLVYQHTFYYENIHFHKPNTQPFAGRLYYVLCMIYNLTQLCTFMTWILRNFAKDPKTTFWYSWRDEFYRCPLGVLHCTYHLRSRCGSPLYTSHRYCPHAAWKGIFY